MQPGQYEGQLRSIEGTWIRGGTSKGLFVREAALPGPPGPQIDNVLLDVFGSPDPLQLNGIGGSKSHTSKLMIVEPGEGTGVDVDYTFAQIGVTEPEVDWTRNCGNLTSAIGSYALIAGLVEATGPTASLTLYNTNTDTHVEQTIPLSDGLPAIYGDYEIHGVPGTGARIDSAFQSPGGGSTGALLPTGNPMDTFSVNGSTLDVSIVDATNLVAFLRAADFGMTGTELPAEMEMNTDLLDRIEALRVVIREELGLVDAKKSSPGIAIVSEPQSYECSVDRFVDATDIGITARFISLQPHHAAPMTGSMCLGATAMIPGTIPHEFATTTNGTLVIGHPKGTVTIEVDVTDTDPPHVASITNRRTMCPLFDGNAFYRTAVV